MMYRAARRGTFPPKNTNNKNSTLLYKHYLLLYCLFVVVYLYSWCSLFSTCLVQCPENGASRFYFFHSEKYKKSELHIVSHRVVHSTQLRSTLPDSFEVVCGLERGPLLGGVPINQHAIFVFVFVQSVCYFPCCLPLRVRVFLRSRTS